MSVRHAVLGLIRERPDHGYRIKKRFEERVGAVWRLNLGQVYQALRSLETNGLIREAPTTTVDRERDTTRPLRSFEVTEKGTRKLDAWLRGPIGPTQPMRDELLIRLLLMERDRREQACDCIDRQEARYQELLARLLARKRKLIARGPDAPLVALLGIEAAELRASAHIKWLQICRTRMKDADAAT